MASLLVIALIVWANAPPVNAPKGLEPEANESMEMIAAAEGMQSYDCRGKKDAAGFEWGFVAPEGEFFDARGRVIGRHGAVVGSVCRLR
jgi:hypothetical protein